MTQSDRPRIHFTAAAGWINDPLALTWHSGEYHVFFQYVPERVTWARECQWGHAISSDLVQWRELEPVLTPGDGDDGVWSGSLVEDSAGRATIAYTSVHDQDLDLGRVRLARPTDDSWGSWIKGPVVVEAPHSPRPRMFRDPFVFRDTDGWRMLVGGSVEGPAAVAFSFSSPDLEAWTYEGVAVERESTLKHPIWTGDGWECPQLIGVDGVHVLITSVWCPDSLEHVAVGTGTWADGRFTPTRWQALTTGGGYYAPSVFRDRDGRPGVVFWIRGIGGAEQGWAGAMSVPHRMTVVDGVLVLQPHPDVVQACTVTEVANGTVTAVQGPTIVRSAEEAGRSLALTEPGFCDVRVDADGDDLVVDLGNGVCARLPQSDARLTILVDGPVMEMWHGPTVFAGSRRRA